MFQKTICCAIFLLKLRYYPNINTKKKRRNIKTKNNFNSLKIFYKAVRASLFA